MLRVFHVQNRSPKLALQARPFSFYSANHFEYWHTEEGSGDLGSLHMNV